MITELVCQNSLDMERVKQLKPDLVLSSLTVPRTRKDYHRIGGRTTAAAGRGAHQS